jgi:hypothetical protein
MNLTDLLGSMGGPQSMARGLGERRRVAAPLRSGPGRLGAAMRINEISWPRIVAEGVAIVVSILLAFAIDRWWDLRQARQEEIAALTPLLDELQRLQVTLSSNDQYHAAIQLSARRLIEVGSGHGEALSDAEIDRLLCDQLWYSSPENLDTPELDFLADSGDLDLVRDPRLRRAIGALPYSLALAKRPMDREYGFFMNRLVPHLARHSAMPQIWNVNCHRPGNPASQFPYGAKLAQAAPVSHRELVEDREFQGLMTARIDILAEAQSSPDLKEAVADCIRQVEQALRSD